MPGLRQDVARLTAAWHDDRLSEADKRTIGFALELIRSDDADDVATAIAFLGMIADAVDYRSAAAGGSRSRSAIAWATCLRPASRP